MIDILQYLPPRTRKSPSGWMSFNGPCCIHNGETQDKRKRGGIIFDNQDWSYSCFNCNFKTRFVHGRQLSLKTKKFLEWLGVDRDIIKQINLDSLKNKKIYDIARQRANTTVQTNIFFDKVDMPGDARRITSTDTWAIDYLKDKRGLDYRDYPYKITPNAKARDRRRIMIPYIYGEDVVGWTSRYMDRSIPKYKNEHCSEGFVFGLNLQKDEWDYVIVTEGIFDAISINATAVMHNQINDKQAAILRRQGKEIIVVPDMDRAGIKLIEQAVELGFSISTPHWELGTDVNDAFMKYGKIGTLLSILNNKTSSKIKSKLAISALRKKLKLNE